MFLFFFFLLLCTSAVARTDTNTGVAAAGNAVRAFPPPQRCRFEEHSLDKVCAHHSPGTPALRGLVFVISCLASLH